MGNPNAVMTALASSRMSLVSTAVLAANLRMEARSPFSPASLSLREASVFTAARFSQVFCFISGGLPSKTNTSFNPCSIKAVVLLNKPIRCGVTLPLESVSAEPSADLIVVRNWYKIFMPSTAKIFPFNSAIEISLDTMISLNFKPIALLPQYYINYYTYKLPALLKNLIYLPCNQIRKCFLLQQILGLFRDLASVQK